MRGDIFNAGDSVDDQESFGFTEPYLKLHLQMKMNIQKKNY